MNHSLGSCGFEAEDVQRKRSFAAWVMLARSNGERRHHRVECTDGPLTQIAVRRSGYLADFEELRVAVGPSPGARAKRCSKLPSPLQFDTDRYPRDGCLQRLSNL
jgi:hypothetical protein